MGQKGALEGPGSGFGRPSRGPEGAGRKFARLFRNSQGGPTRPPKIVLGDFWRAGFGGAPRGGFDLLGRKSPKGFWWHFISQHRNVFP